MDIQIRRMLPYEIGQIASIDRSDRYEAEYAVVRDEADPLCLRLRRRELEKPSFVPTWSDSELRTRMQAWRRNLAVGASFWGAFQRDRLLGFALMSERFSDRTAELYSLFVDAGHRRQGVGSRLLECVEREAEAMGARAVCLFTTLPNACAIDFCLKSGYRVIGIHDSEDMKTEGWELRLAKMLSPATGAADTGEEGTPS